MSQPRSIKDRRRASATFSRASERAKSLLNQSHLTPKREHLGIILNDRLKLKQIFR